MIKKIAFGLLSVSALTMLTALPAFAAGETDIAAEITPGVSVEEVPQSLMEEILKVKFRI